MILEILSGILAILFFIVTSFVLYAEMSDITHHPEYKSISTYLASVLWYIGSLIVIVCAHALSCQISSYHWTASYSGLVVIWSIAFVLIKQAFRTLDYHITGVDYHAIMKGGSKTSGS